MFLQVGLLGHVLTLELRLTPEEDAEPSTEIGGGSGGSFERYIEPAPEWYEGEEWEEEKAKGFGFK